MSTDAQNDERQKLVELAAKLMSRASFSTRGMSDGQKQEHPDHMLLLAAAATCKWHFEHNGTPYDVQIDVLAAAVATVADAIELREGCDCPRCRAEAMGEVVSSFATGIAHVFGLDMKVVTHLVTQPAETVLQ